MDKKSIIKALESRFECKAKYLGTPSFAYEIETERGTFRVEKDGQIRTETGEIIELESILADPLETTEESGRLVLEMPLDDFTEKSLANLEKLIASKANLIKKAIDADALPIERTEDSLRFPWFKLPYDSEVVLAYSKFIIALCNAAKLQKRITAKEKETDNEKYAFRCFLLRIGFIGDEYKSARKILLTRLEGNSAFKAQIKGGQSQ